MKTSTLITRMNHKIKLENNHCLSLQLEALSSPSSSLAPDSENEELQIPVLWPPDGSKVLPQAWTVTPATANLRGWNCRRKRKADADLVLAERVREIERLPLAQRMEEWVKELDEHDKSRAENAELKMRLITVEMQLLELKAFVEGVGRQLISLNQLVKDRGGWTSF